MSKSPGSKRHAVTMETKPSQLHHSEPAAFNKCTGFSGGACSLWRVIPLFQRKCCTQQTLQKCFFFFFSMPNYFRVPEVVYLAILFTKFTKSKGLSRLFTQCCWSPLFTESHYCLCQQRPCFSAGGAWTWEIEIQGHALGCCYKYAAWREGKKNPQGLEQAARNEM